jgi:hypothetical protein
MRGPIYPEFPETYSIPESSFDVERIGLSSVYSRFYGKEI